MKDFKFDLGSEVKDKITGFKGIVRCRTQYQTGCNVYGVQSTKLKDNAPTAWVHFDEGQLSLLKKGKSILTEGDTLRSTKGGPSSPDQYSPSK